MKCVQYNNQRSLHNYTYNNMQIEKSREEKQTANLLCAYIIGLRRMLVAIQFPIPIIYDRLYRITPRQKLQFSQ